MTGSLRTRPAPNRRSAGRGLSGHFGRSAVQRATLLLVSAALLTAAPGRALGQASAAARPAGSSLERGFEDPPDSAKPRVWWHWMNGNVTKAGITADLEWMKRVGIGGFQMFDGSLWVPQFVDKRLVWPAAYMIENGRTIVPLRLDPAGSVFVVCRGKAAAASRSLPRAIRTELATLEGPWQVSFPPNWGAPPEVTFDSLVSWTASSDDGVKYFSGTAAYTKTLDVPAEWVRPGATVVLELGRVNELAEVSVNGRPLGVVWKPPFQADVTAALKPGANRLEIKVTNLWPNRIIVDQYLPTDERFTFSTASFPGAPGSSGYTKDSPLLESGLLGPVKLIALTFSPIITTQVVTNVTQPTLKEPSVRDERSRHTIQGYDQDGAPTCVRDPRHYAMFAETFRGDPNAKAILMSSPPSRAIRARFATDGLD
jgi:hypothetical protein